jgi:tetratricopeptide (TPR) repeat protein
MKARHTILLLVAWLAIASIAPAIDTIKRKGGQDSVLGRIASMDKKKVIVAQGSKKVRVPAGEIRAIYFSGEPDALRQARANTSHGRYEDALRQLGELKKGEIKGKMLRGEVEFLKAFCKAQLALRGTGSVPDAGREMAAFAAKYDDNYHWYEANRIVGDLLLANRRYDSAIEYYSKVADAPGVELKLLAAVDVGWAEMVAGRTSEAMNSFDTAIKMKTPDRPNFAVQKAIAEIGLARCIVDKGRAKDAVEQIRKIIDKTDPKNVVLGARAYNALGTALRAEGKPREALLAFLHVDILYFTSPEDHAEALANLMALWQEVGKPDRALQARETLEQRYKNSRWAPR